MNNKLNVFFKIAHLLIPASFPLSEAPPKLPFYRAAVFKTVLKQEETKEKAKNSYIDDVLVDEPVAQVEKVKFHLKNTGQRTKPTELLN